MADPQIVTTLQRKRDEIEQVIALYTKKIEDARLDLSHVNATLRLFEITGEPEHVRVYLDTRRLFARTELSAAVVATLSEKGPLDVREIARHVIRSRGMDDNDHVLRKSIIKRITQSLRGQEKRGKVIRLGKREAALVWKLK